MKQVMSLIISILSGALGPKDTKCHRTIIMLQFVQQMPASCDTGMQSKSKPLGYMVYKIYLINLKIYAEDKTVKRQIIRASIIQILWLIRGIFIPLISYFNNSSMYSSRPAIIRAFSSSPSVLELLQFYYIYYCHRTVQLQLLTCFKKS